MSSIGSIAGLKVMVIDDSNTIRRSAEIFLKQGGYEVLLAEALHRFLAVLGGTHGEAALAEQVGHVMQLGLRVVDEQDLLDRHEWLSQQRFEGGLGGPAQAARRCCCTACSSWSFVNGLVR